MPRFARLGWTFVFLFLPVSSSLAENILELNQSFMEKYKNKLAISVHYTVDAAHKRPNPASKDGDMHIAGRAPEIGLATVAEIQNAKEADIRRPRDEVRKGPRSVVRTPLSTDPY
jgi:hypothetical protein